MKTALVIMGVAGAGKTTVGNALAERLGWPMADSDGFHSEANKAKMAGGTPLTDEDRWPWLQSIRDWITEQPGDAVVTCSALRKVYRDVLREADARVVFIHLDGPESLFRLRMLTRTGHFMPTSLMKSQVATLEALEDDEDGFVVAATANPGVIADTVLEKLGPVGS